MNESAEQMEKVTQNLMRACDEMNVNCRNSMNAVIESTSALTKGCDEMNRNISVIMQESMGRALDAGKTMMSAKSLQQIAGLQTEFVQGLFGQWMSGTGQLSKISMRMTQEVLESVTKQARDVLNQASQRKTA